MQARITRIGNARGLRNPKALLEACRLTDEAALSVEEGAPVIRRAAPPRAGWEEAFAETTAVDAGGLLDPPVATSWDQRERDG